MIYLLLVIVMVIASILMCFIVLVQNSKGGGLASAFQSSNSIMGVRKTTDFLEKSTWTLAAVMVVISIVAAYTVPTAVERGDVILEQAQREGNTNPYNLPIGNVATPSADEPATPVAPAAPAGDAQPSGTGE